MADVNFTTQFVPRHAGAKAQRLAVLKPLAPGVDLVHDAEVPAAVFQALGYWRRRCNELREVGWEPAQGVKFQYMRNCPPTVASMRPDNRRGYTRPCRVTSACPWCWCREVVKRTWDVVRAAMDQTGNMFVRGGGGNYPHKLAIRTARVLVQDSEDQPRTLLDKISTLLLRTKRVYEKHSVGACYLAIVHPSKGGWAYTTRVLTLLPQEYQVREGTRVVVHPTRRNVATAVARFARYPRGLMFGDADRLRRLLEVRSRYRLLRFAGVFSSNYRPGNSESDSDSRFLDM